MMWGNETMPDPEAERAKLDPMYRAVERHQADLMMDKARRAERRSIDKMLTDSPPRIGKAFWCRKCRLDFETAGRRRLTWLRGRPFVYYFARCPECRRKCVRQVTNGAADPYWRQSMRVRRARCRSAADILQPGEFGFNTLYPDTFRQHIEDAREEQERIDRENYDSSMRFYRSKEARRKMRQADWRFRETDPMTGRSV